MKEVKGMKEAPQAALQLLYLLRPLSAVAIPYKDYIKFYNFIVVEGVGYYTTEEERWRVDRWLEAPEKTMYAAQIPDAIIAGGYALKNRYGYNSF